MARGVLKKIQPLHPEMKPPKGAVAFGVTPDGRHQLYKLVTPMTKSVPRMESTPAARLREAELKAEGKTVEEIAATMNGEGFRHYRKHIATGEVMYGINRPVPWQKEEIFYLVSQGNGNIGKEPYYPPSAEEEAVERQKRQALALRDALPELMAKEGITAEDLVAAIRTSRSQNAAKPQEIVPRDPAGVAPGDLDEDPDLDFPIAMGGGWWRLSDGSKVQGKELTAKEAEEKLPADIREAAKDARRAALANADF